MKNASIALILLCLTCASASCQTPPKKKPLPVGAGLFPIKKPPKDFPVEPQWYNYSCWAASLSMASKYIARDSTQMNQCYFVDQLFGGDTTQYCGCNTLMSGEIVSLSEDSCSGEHSSSGPDDLSERFGLAQSINTNAKQLTRAIDLKFLRSTLKEGNPVIHSYRFQDYSGGSGKHVYLISGIETPRWKKLETSFGTNLLLVKDPWPVHEGSEYYLTFEQYHLHKEQENIFFDENQPGPFPQFETVSYMKNIFNTSNAATPLIAAQRFVTKLKKIDPNSVSAHFLRKSGIQKNLAHISVYPEGIDVEEIDSYGPIAAPVTDSVVLQNLGNTDIMFFLIHDGIAKSALTVSKRDYITGENETFTDKWFISRLEKADRYLTVYDSLRISAPNTLAILRYKGSVSGEILAKKLPVKGEYMKVKILSKEFNSATKNQN